MRRKRKVAVFDIDGTFFRSSLFIELTESLIDEGLFPKEARSVYLNAYHKWRKRKDSYEKYIGGMIQAFLKYLPGVSYKEFMRVSEAVVECEGEKVYRYTRDLARKLKKKGYFLLAISHSPKGILDKFCQKLGFDKVYGRIYETDSLDKLTGKVTDLHLIENKGAIVKRAVEKENLTLDNSIGIGDTESDIPVLELVSHPICFNPNAKLYRYAKLNKWSVVVERKDVIHEIS